MKTILKTNQKTTTDLDIEVSRFIFKIISLSAVILGIWGAACLISAAGSFGLTALAKSYLTALTGM